ncbi:unnamed protein product [Ilex paraguariensis]|uniref:Uncharacterized protein n=1 Tax=Ilex paraguariensis TaxID=185542 RepID=A0ABC8U7J2_9AQUA
MVFVASSHGGNMGVNAKRKEGVTVEELVNVHFPDLGLNERKTIISNEENMQDFDKRLSTVEVTVSAIRSNHEALFAKFTFEVNENKKMLETLSERELLDNNETEVGADRTNEVIVVTCNQDNVFLHMELK